MKKIFEYGVSFALAVLMFGCGGGGNENLPIEVSKGVDWNPYALMHPKEFDYLMFSSKVDSVKIKEVIVNRGNCKPSSANEMNKKVLKFGENERYLFRGRCDIKEAEIHTDLGVWFFTLQ